MIECKHNVEQSVTQRSSWPHMLPTFIPQWGFNEWAVKVTTGYHAWWRHQMEKKSRYWRFVRGIHRSPVNNPHDGQWHRALTICACTSGWANHRDASDLRRHRIPYEVTVMLQTKWSTLMICIIAELHGPWYEFVLENELIIFKTRFYNIRIYSYMTYIFNVLHRRFPRIGSGRGPAGRWYFFWRNLLTTYILQHILQKLRHIVP